jgi:hypothetical protein
MGGAQDVDVDMSGDEPEDEGGDEDQEDQEEGDSAVDEDDGKLRISASDSDDSAPEALADLETFLSNLDPAASHKCRPDEVAEPGQRTSTRHRLHRSWRRERVWGTHTILLFTGAFQQDIGPWWVVWMRENGCYITLLRGCMGNVFQAGLLNTLCVYGSSICDGWGPHGVVSHSQGAERGTNVSLYQPHVPSSSRILHHIRSRCMLAARLTLGNPLGFVARPGAAPS